MSAFMLMRDSIKMQTRRKSDIDNYFDRTPPRAGAHAQIVDCRDKYKAIHYDNIGPTSLYNCHGLTFASRRTQITDSDEIDKILDEDEYNIINENDAHAGDIAIYRLPNGEIEHSGIVVGRAPIILGGREAPLILSKWGDLHEVVHSPGICEWGECAVTYYRVRT